MSKMFGALTSDDNEFGFLATEGQEVVYEVANENTRMHNEDMELMMATFVSETTEIFKTKYKLPVGGRMQRVDRQSRPGVSKQFGEWDVAFKLEDFMEGFSGNRIDLAYTSAKQLELHMTSAFSSNRNTMRFEVLKQLFNNNQVTFPDEERGDLTIEPLANDDGTEYPPILGSEDEAEENHYLGSGYIAANIDDDNNPLDTLEDEIIEHFGDTTGGNNIIVFHNQAQTDQLAALEDFTSVENTFIRLGDNADIPIGLPNVPGVIKGRTSTVWTSEWRWMPANYLLAIHLEVEAPLKMRVDPASTQIPRGLNMVFSDDRFPFNDMYWQHRYGFGTANRLNGAVMFLNATSSYTIPTTYQ